MEYVYRTIEQRLDGEMQLPDPSELPWEIHQVSSTRDGYSNPALIVVWRVAKAQVLLHEKEQQEKLDRLVNKAVGVLIGVLAMKVQHPKQGEKVKLRLENYLRSVHPREWGGLGAGVIKDIRAEAEHLARNLGLDDEERFLEELVKKAVYGKVDGI